MLWQYLVTKAYIQEASHRISWATFGGAFKADAKLSGKGRIPEEKPLFF